jgi:hypothetical protein
VIILWLAVVPGTLAIPCIHPYFPKQRAGFAQKAQLIHLSSSKVCSKNFSRAALNSSSTSICESPAWHSIFVSHAGKLVPLCQIFRLRASFRPALPLAHQICKHGWTQGGLRLGLNCIPIHDTGENSFRPKIPPSFIFLFMGNLPSRSAAGQENSPRLQR